MAISRSKRKTATGELPKLVETAIQRTAVKDAIQYHCNLNPFPVGSRAWHVYNWNNTLESYATRGERTRANEV